MKIQTIVSALVCTGFLIGISGCQGYRPTTSHFGHGTYRCYYQNVQSNKMVEGRADTESQATLIARKSCLGECKFVDCVFK